LRFLEVERLLEMDEAGRLTDDAGLRAALDDVGARFAGAATGAVARRAAVRGVVDLRLYSRWGAIGCSSVFLVGCCFVFLAERVPRTIVSFSLSSTRASRGAESVHATGQGFG
jgi:hypothetical protein